MNFTRLLGIILLLSGAFVWWIQVTTKYTAFGIFVTIFALLVGIWLVLAPGDRK